MAQANTHGARRGERRGGRTKGTPNKRTLALRMGLEAARAYSDLATPPFKFLSDVMTNENNELPVRIDAAKALLPYTNFRKGLVDTSGRDLPITVNVIRFSDLPEPELPVIEHDSSPTSH